MATLRTVISSIKGTAMKCGSGIGSGGWMEMVKGNDALSVLNFKLHLKSCYSQQTVPLRDTQQNTK